MNTFNTKIITFIFAFLIFFSGSAFANAIWTANKNEFIKYAEQDKSIFGKNDHPIELKVEEISKALESLKIPKKDGADEDKGQILVFTDDQIDLLSQNLAKGLTTAKPNQDIIFALQKRDDKIFGLIKNQYFVAGRAFYKDGKLNIIIGDYDRSRDKGFEAAYDPTKVGIVKYHFDHGRRSKSSKGFKKTILKVEGIENKQIEDTRRNDWLVIDLKLVSEASVLKAKLQKQEEMERKRRELKEILGSEETSPSPPTAVPVPAPVTAPTSAPTIVTVPTTATRSAEERLRTLNNLKEKGLITNEEYATKRKQILEEL